MSATPDGEVGVSEEAEVEPTEELDLSGASIVDLAREGDADGLFLVAKAARTGTHGRPRDLACAFAAYRAAGELGHAGADYAAALFHLNGTATPRDLKEGTAVLRRAADRGSLDAKITLGNLYELGVHYARDAEKADVWYRNAARAAGLAAPGTREFSHDLAMLGAARYAEALATDPTATDDERERAQRKARAHGGNLRDLRDRASSVPAEAPATAGDATPGPSDAKDATARTPAAQAPSPDPEAARKAKLAELAAKAKVPSRLTGKAGVGAFLYALLFTATAFGAAFAADAGARELVAHGGAVPVFGARVELVFPVMLGVVAVLPQLLVYRVSSVARALALGAVTFGVGWVLHNTGKLALVDARLNQAVAFAGAGLLAALLAQGLFGGAKGDRPERPVRARR